MLYKKFTTGYVEQTFNDAGECIQQKFVSVDDRGIEYETEDGDPINVMDMPLAGREYFPFDMKQPQEES
jgi:hypothetical protein